MARVGVIPTRMQTTTGQPNRGGVGTPRSRQRGTGCVRRSRRIPATSRSRPQTGRHQGWPGDRTPRVWDLTERQSSPLSNPVTAASTVMGLTRPSATTRHNGAGTTPHDRRLDNGATAIRSDDPGDAGHIASLVVAYPCHARHTLAPQPPSVRQNKPLQDAR